MESRTENERPRKRPRIVAQVACENCRRRKQGCDGQRPTCTPCTSRNVTCRYEYDPQKGESRQGAVKREKDDHKHQLEDLASAFEILRKLPDEDAHQAFGRIRMADDPLAALTSLRTPSPQSNGPLSEHKSIRAAFPKPQTRLEFELSMSHPNSYPILIPRDSTLVAWDSTPTTLPMDSMPRLPSSRIDPVLLPSTLSMDQRNIPASGTSWLDYQVTSDPLPSDGIFGPPPPSLFCDDRLARLDIRRWTNVHIRNDYAAMVISLYLETDHSILGFFDADLFVDDLVNLGTRFCSPLLVNSLLFWACQAYNSIDHDASHWGRHFLAEAQHWWHRCRYDDHILTAAASMILSLGCATNGDDKLSKEFKYEGTRMGQRLGLFNTQKSPKELARDNRMEHDLYRAHAHIAWGAFNWICLHSIYYPGLPAQHSPTFDIPDGSMNGVPAYMGSSFRTVCTFRRIINGYVFETNAGEEKPSLAFAETKYRELLDWADHLRGFEKRGGRIAHHVMVYHIWYHTAIIDIFRPLCSQNLTLQTFTTTTGTPEAVCAASLRQLKCLVVDYRSSQPSALYSILWHTALLYIGNAVLGTHHDADWRFYFDLCISTYAELSSCYRIASGWVQGLLYMAVKQERIQLDEARRTLQRFNAKSRQVFGGDLDATSTHIVDLDLAVASPQAAQIDMLAEQITNLTTVDEFGDEGVAR